MMATNWQVIANDLDFDDPLANYRDRFRRSDTNLIYLDGNSLGMLPYKTEQVINKVVSEEWGDALIEGWNKGWWHMPMEMGKLISKIVGAKESEVLVCDSTSINLFKLLVSSLKATPGRSKIVSDSLNFPSDLYIIQGVIENVPGKYYLELANSKDGIEIDIDHLKSLIDQDTAVVVLTQVCFRSGYMYDIKEITAYAHKMGALIIWDLSHSAGVVEVDLNGANADMAVGCTYKYLNCGPGSPAYLYIRKDLQKKLISPIWGWLGEKNPFGFSTLYRPAEDIRQFLTGTPGILSMSTIKSGVSITMEAGLSEIRKKSVKMTQFLISMAEELLIKQGFTTGSPANADKRGSHVSLRHKEAYRICKALIDPSRGDYKVIPDFRPPDNIRLGLVPLYNRFDEIYFAITKLEWIVKEEVYKEYDDNMEGVT